MPRNEDLQNLKPLSTSESPKTILSTSEAQELHTAVGKLRNTHRAFIEVLGFFAGSFSGSTWLSLLHSIVNHLTFFGHDSLQYMTSFS